jgi:diaminopimelate decarboxylase
MRDADRRRIFQRVSGIHWNDIDDLWIQRPWDELNLEAYGEKVRALLDDGALWISGSDLEAMWLASVFPERPPQPARAADGALKRIAKPAVEAHEGLPVKVPTFVSTDLPDWELHAFCREHDWRVWLKGPYYDAGAHAELGLVRRRPQRADQGLVDRAPVPAGACQRLRGIGDALRLRGRAARLRQHAQARHHARGQDLGRRRLRSRSREFEEPLREMVKELNWTGGGELEMVRDAPASCGCSR